MLFIQSKLSVSDGLVPGLQRRYRSAVAASYNRRKIMTIDFVKLVDKC